MFSPTIELSYESYIRRRKTLLELIEQHYPGTSGALFLPAAFENARTTFRQDSTFYYYTGISEPAVSLLIDMRGHTTLYAPSYTAHRATWLPSALDTIEQDPTIAGIDTISPLGKAISGYQATPWLSTEVFQEMCTVLKEYVQRKNPLFICMANLETSTRGFLERLMLLIPNMSTCIIDISTLVATMRRIKDMDEIELIYQAVELTVLGQEAAAQAIAPDRYASEIQGQIEYIFTASGAQTAFATIVASGAQALILHQKTTATQLSSDDLVIVDCGADIGHYTGDLSRTYPVSGTFNKRQRELYMIVLETQHYIAQIARPGYWLSNENNPDTSLNHLAQKFLVTRGYDRFIAHGISHFIGLDVHDVGSLQEPLSEGNIITIEPGLYLPDEHIGIRIEDMYWITKNGAICMSEGLARTPNDIEALMKGKSLNDQEGWCDEDTNERHDCCS